VLVVLFIPLEVEEALWAYHLWVREVPTLNPEIGKIL
jgi:hypothetical protein